MLASLAAIEGACGLVAAAAALGSSLAVVWLPGPMYVLGMVLWFLAFRARLVRLPGATRVVGSTLLAGTSYFAGFLGFAFSGGVIDRFWPQARLEAVIPLWIAGVAASLVLAGALRVLRLGRFWSATGQLVAAATLAQAASALVGGLFGNGIFFLLGVGQALLALPVGAVLAPGRRAQTEQA